MSRKLMTICTLVFVAGLSVTAYAQSTSDFLILNNIGEYIFRSNRVTVIENAGPLVPTGHFRGHGDITYEGIYIHPQTYLGAEVQITQHSGSDADEWLLHEISRDFRNYYGLPGDNFVMREINGATIMAVGSGGWDYRWLSGNKVIHIAYTDLQMEKPEPLEIVKAYLAKHPSTLPAMTSADLRTSANETIWIKDEMTRRLWLCDKWLIYSQTGKVERSDLVRELVDHLTVFLRYRDKYYNVAAESDLVFLYDCKQTNNQPKIEKKVAEYKAWWAANKNKPITLP